MVKLFFLKVAWSGKSLIVTSIITPDSDIYIYYQFQDPSTSQDPDSNNHGADLCWQRFKTRFNEVVRDVIRFAKKIPGFMTLDLEDQVSLIKGGCFEVGQLNCKIS